MPPPLNILFAEPPSGRRVGGIETALTGLAASLAREGVTVRRADRFERPMVAAADLVHFHGLWEPAHHRARRWCRQLRKSFIVSPHGMLESWALRHRGWKKLPYFYLVERRSVGHADVILGTSEDEAAALRRWFPAEKLRALSLGADPVPVPPATEARRKLGLPPGAFVILFLSRCHEKKGLHLLIAAVPEAARAGGRPVHLVVVGDGEPAYVAPLQRATAGWTGNLQCTWAGARWGPEKWDYLSAADLFCLPSYSENFGVAVLEALFAGTPALTTPATPWGSLRGHLPVRLTEPEVPALVAALRECAALPPPTEAERAATRAAAIDIFAWPVLAPRYVELYRQLAALRT